MNEYDVTFLVLALIVAYRVRINPRAIAWLASCAASYIVSAWYHRAGYPNPALTAAVCDAVVATMIYAHSKYLWEMYLGRIIKAMLAVNVIFVAHPVVAKLIPDLANLMSPSRWHNVYALMLDLANLSVLAWIWFSGTRQKAGDTDGISQTVPARFSLRRFVRSLQHKRAHPPWWFVSK